MAIEIKYCVKYGMRKPIKRIKYLNFSQISHSTYPVLELDLNRISNSKFTDPDLVTAGQLVMDSQDLYD